jgi:hypothetical protein
MAVAIAGCAGGESQLVDDEMTCRQTRKRVPAVQGRARAMRTRSP